MATYKGKYTAAVFEPADVTLISVTYQNDAIGQPIATEKKTIIPGRIGSVSATEDERAGQRGFKAEKEAVIWSFDYHEEEIAEVNGKRYQIYRYYKRSDGRTELYLGQKAGTN